MTINRVSTGTPEKYASTRVRITHHRTWNAVEALFRLFIMRGIIYVR